MFIKRECSEIGVLIKIKTII